MTVERRAVMRSGREAVRDAAVPPPAPSPRPRLLFLATEDWYFWSDRLPTARALRDGGCDIVVAAREGAHGERIRAEGFALHSLAWRRRGDGLLGAVKAVRAIIRLYRDERPDIINHVALKPIVFGGIARRLAFAVAERPASIDWMMGLGAAFVGRTTAAALRRALLGLALRITTHDRSAHIVVQNPEDGAALARLGVDPARIVVIRGSGVDVSRFVPLPEPPGPEVTVALVARMLRSKGILDAVEAVRRVRGQGRPIELLLAGGCDPDNRDSLDERTLGALAAEPGVAWLGPVADVREVWRRAAVAMLPSSYGEGLPRALLEAAACARPIVATDVPGCREIVRHGVNGLLVPPHDIGALAEALAALAGDGGRRQAMGRAGRALVEREFGEARVADETLALYQGLLRERSEGR